MHCPEIPEFPLLASSGFQTSVVHWMLAAEVASSLDTGQEPDGATAAGFVSEVMRRVEAFWREDSGTVQASAQRIAELVLRGGQYWTGGRSNAVGSEITAANQPRMCGRSWTRGGEHDSPRERSAGGETDTCVIVSQSSGPGEATLNGSTLPSLEEELQWAESAREAGNFVIGIGPEDHSKLSAACDVYFSNRCSEPEGIVEVGGEMICPATGIVNCIIMQSLIAQVVDEMCARGAVPYAALGVYRTQGRAYNEAMAGFFEARGY